MIQEYKPQDELDRLIAKWDKVHRDVRVVPIFWSILFIIGTLIFVNGQSQMTGQYVNMPAAMITMFGIILAGIIGGTVCVWWINYRTLLPKLLKYDDFRIIPCLIQATTPQHFKHHAVTIERLTYYLNVMTVNDAVLFKENHYRLLHECLTGLDNNTFDRRTLPNLFRLSILCVIKEMGHTRSIPNLKFLADANPDAHPGKIYQLPEMRAAVMDCLDSLLKIQEQAKHDSTLLRPAQAEAAPDTLLRAASPINPGTDNLLRPADEKLAEVERIRALFADRKFSDSTELLREDRNR